MPPEKVAVPLPLPKKCSTVLPAVFGRAWGRLAVGVGLFCLGLPALSLEPQGLAAKQEKPALIPRTEYEMKAFFMVNFARFVDWPDGADPAGGAVISLGILGKDPFGPALDLYSGQLVKGQKIVIRRSRELKDLMDCRILFIGEASPDLLRILKESKDRSVLTFGESEDFIRMGGMVRFLMEDKKVQMQVNRRAYTEARLKISSHLLAITTVVNP